MASSGSTLVWGDYLVIAAYFLVVLGVGLFSSYRSKKGSVSGYFLASRNMHWIPVGASLFASNIGSGHFIGLAGSGAASGIGIGVFELNAIFVLMILGWIFVPVYMTAKVYTMPEYLRERFGGQRIRMYLAVLTLILYVFTKISADLYAGALFITEAIGQSSDEGWLYFSILILLAIAALFTITGGLTAVIWTDFIQTIIMVIGAFVLMATAFKETGGYENMIESYFYAIPQNVSKEFDDCTVPPADSMHMFRSINSDLPWTGVLLGATISSLWYWCTDQVIVQRTLASKDLTHAKGGCLLASVLKFLPLWLIVFPGMASRVLYPDTVGCVDPDTCREACQSESGCTNLAYIKLVLNLLSPGMRGLMLAVMLAALMSSLTSIFNSASTIFTIDIWQKIRQKAWLNKEPGMVEVEKLVVGRLFVLVLIVVSVIWIPVIQSSQNSQLFVYIQNITSFLAPPVCAVYLLAFFWDRTTEPGAFWGLMVGLVIGLIRFGLEFGYTIPTCASGKPDPRPEIIKLIVGNVNYLHFACLLFLFTLMVAVPVSLFTEPIPEECLYRLTWNTRYRTEVRVSIKKYRKETDHSDSTESKTSIDSFNEKPRVEEPKWKTLLFKACGGGSGDENTQEIVEVIDPVKEAKEAVEILNEDPKRKVLVDTAAILILTGATFFCGFYA